MPKKHTLQFINAKLLTLIYKRKYIFIYIRFNPPFTEVAYDAKVFISPFKKNTYVDILYLHPPACIHTLTEAYAQQLSCTYESG